MIAILTRECIKFEKKKNIEKETKIYKIKN